MTIYISGGCKNGKSSIAEDCCVALANGGPLYYIATMQAFDEEDERRIVKHQNSRAGKGFETLEQPLHIIDVINKSDYANGTYILDSVTALMINELYSKVTILEDGSYDYSADKDAPQRVSEEIIDLMNKAKNIVFVSDFIYSEADDYSEFTLEYLKSLAYVDKAVAKHCDAVAEVCLGNINMIKGELPL